MKDNYTDYETPDGILMVYEPNYWKNKIQWIDSPIRLKLNLLPDYSLSDEEYYRQQDSIREIMELNMVMYGKW